MLRATVGIYDEYSSCGTEVAQAAVIETSLHDRVRFTIENNSYLFSISELRKALDFIE
jgi:hypothetical protein